MVEQRPRLWAALIPPPGSQHILVFLLEFSLIYALFRCHLHVEVSLPSRANARRLCFEGILEGAFIFVPEGLFVQVVT